MANTKRKGETAEASQMTIKADTVMAPNTLSRTVFEVGSDWSTVTFFFPAAIVADDVKDLQDLAIKLVPIWSRYLFGPCSHSDEEDVTLRTD